MICGQKILPEVEGAPLYLDRHEQLSIQLFGLRSSLSTSSVSAIPRPRLVRANVDTLC